MAEKCSQCGAELPPESAFCNKCGAPTKPLRRPVTITVASLIYGIFGLLTLFAGVAIAGIAGTLAGASGTESLANLIVGVLGGIAALVALIGLFDLGVCYGLWNMKRWAAVLGMLLSAFGIIIESAFDQIARMFWGSWYYNPPSSEYIPGYLFASSISTASIWVYILVFIMIAISWRAFEYP